MTSKNMGIRFGMVAVDKGFVKTEDVIEALEIQYKENVFSEKHRLIGDILNDQGLMTTEQINEVLQILGEYRSDK
jgi:hypothetical protein